MTLRRTPALELSGALVAVTIASLSSGAVRIGPTGMLAILGDALGFAVPWEAGETERAVLLAIRLPRVLLGALVGAALGVSGAVMQGLFRNPLAEPGLVGISSGAALAAVVVLVLGGGGLPGVAVPLAAFAGGLAVTALVQRLGQVDGRTAVVTMLLAGIALNALAGAATGLLVFVADDASLRSVTFWMLGSLGGATWPALAAVAPLLVGGLALASRLAVPLNALLLGESEAGHLGIEVERSKRRAVALVALAVGAAVSVTGIIGFVGLVAPHLVRMAIGADHRALLPASGLLGAVLILAADLVARTVVAPAELPIGVVTSLVGAPYFLWLLLRDRGGASLR